MNKKKAGSSVDANGWSTLEEGDITCGPGSYYLSDRTITERHEGIKTLGEAKKFVEQDTDARNPIIIWQLSNPWGKDKPQHLIFHRLKFMSQNLDANTGQTAGDFCRAVSGFAKGKRWGSPMFFRAEASKATVPPTGKTSAPLPDNQSTNKAPPPAGWPAPPSAGWSTLEEGDICCGPGSYYLSDRTITERHEGIKTLSEAKKFVEQDTDARNPIIIWQLSNPWGKDKPQHLIFHRLKFMSQNLDANTGQTAGDFCRCVSRGAKGKRWGSPMFFRAEASKATVPPTGKTSAPLPDNQSTKQAPRPVCLPQAPPPSAVFHAQASNTAVPSERKIYLRIYFALWKADTKALDKKPRRSGKTSAPLPDTATKQAPPPPSAGPSSKSSLEQQQQDEIYKLKREVSLVKHERTAAEKRAMEAQQQKQAAQSASSGGVTHSGPQCCICLDGPAEFLLVPCGHQCLCSGLCKTKLEQTEGSHKVCPMCNTPFTMLVKVFAS